MPKGVNNHIVTDSRRGLAMVFMVISSVVISFGGLIMRNIEAAQPLQVNFYRAVGLLSAIIVFLILRYRSEVVSIVIKIGWVGILGGTLLAIAGMAHMQAMAYTTIANALFVLGAIPFFAALFARVALKEKLNRSTLITMLVAVIGLGIMVKEGITVGSIYGNVMGIITAMFFAVYAVIVRGKRRTDMMPTLLVSAFIIMITTILGTQGDLTISHFDLILCIIWGAVLSGVANFLFIYASRHLTAAEVTLFMLLEFSLGPIWVWWFVYEVPSLGTIVGGIMIMLAVAIRAIAELTGKPGIEQIIK